MSDVVEELTALAFDRAPPAEANERIEAVREAIETRSGSPAFSYELFAPRLGVDAWFGEQALPRLIYFLSCRGLRSARAPGVFVSLFTADGLLFLHAGDVVERLAARRGLTVEVCFQRYGDGGTGEPKALGPG
jgi:hypothetical protein